MSSSSADGNAGEEPVGLGDQRLGAELAGGIDREEVVPVQMREPVVAVQHARADAPHDPSTERVGALAVGESGHAEDPRLRTIATAAAAAGVDRSTTGPSRAGLITDERVRDGVGGVLSRLASRMRG